MDNFQFSSPGESRFSERLREAARRERPQFSESLHARIMQAVRSSPAAGDRQASLPKRQPSSRWFLRRIYLRNAAWLAVAAAVVAAVILARSQLVPAGGNDRVVQNVQHPTAVPGNVISPRVHPITLETDADDSLVDDEANELVDSISSSVAVYSLNDLSRDARTTAHLLVDELPFGSADEWGL